MNKKSPFTSGRESGRATQGFTLVELIVVITILSILGTIGFVSFNGYTSSARDSVRISDLTNIQKGLDLYQVKAGYYPIPDNAVNITASGETNIIGYQGYASGTVLSLIKLSDGGGKDPLDNTYYTYLTNSNKTKYQLLNFLENQSSIAYNSHYSELNSNNVILANAGIHTIRTNGFPFSREGHFFVDQAYADLTDYSKRYINTTGDQLGILLHSGTFVPIQANNGTGVDIVNTTGSYIAQFSNKDTDAIKGTGQQLVALKNILQKGHVSSLVGYWDMETTTTDGKLADLSGNGNHGTINGTPLMGVDGVIGKAISFDENPESIIIDDKNNIAGSTSHTISCWITTSSVYSSIITKHSTYYDIHVNSKKILARIVPYDNPAKPALNIVSSENINDNKWHHVLQTWDSGNLKLFVDGKFQTSGVSSTSIATNVLPIYIGSYTWGTCPTKCSAATAIIDEARIYNRALSESEIQALYNATK
ncbi:prepilin-type N-terminal cleavage/methylation domain-containing protein [Candidatus Gracilibacteria bacterium]|nr:prepilin-type N-terminal cleavage/methylation domain-containing protein [Candidatus Gracilibacteria bacterium]